MISSSLGIYTIPVRCISQHPNPIIFKLFLVTTMGDLTANFSRSEFKCHCGKCDFDTVDAGLVLMLENIRSHFGRPVTINSACRCARHNAAVGGSAKSQHLYGRAADIRVVGIDPPAVADYAETLNPGGLGRYATFTHIDSRTSGPARWGSV